MHDFYWRQLLKIYYVTIKTFPLLEALSWANWSWLLFLNVLYATTTSSDTTGEENSCKAPHSKWWLMSSSHQVNLISLLQGVEKQFCCCYGVGEGFGESIGVLKRGQLDFFFCYIPSPYHSSYSAVQNMTGEGWNWEGIQCISKMKTLFIAGL